MKNVGKAARQGRTSEVLADTVDRERKRADEMDRRYREQAARQSASITRFVEFLQEQNLMDEFNQWASRQQRDGRKSEEQSNGG